MKKYKYINGVATNLIKKEKKAFSLKWFSKKLFLFGICVSAKIGAIILKDKIAQFQ
jgi:hypothetical protein